MSWCIEAQQEAAQADGAGLAFSIFDLFALLKLLTLLGCRQRGCNPQTLARTVSWHTTAEAPNPLPLRSTTASFDELPRNRLVGPVRQRNHRRRRRRRDRHNIIYVNIGLFVLPKQPLSRVLLWSKHPSRRREVRRNALSRRRPGGGTMRVTHKRRGRRNIEGDSIGVECFKTSRERAGRGRARRPSAAAASPLLQQRERRFLL